MPNPNAKDPDTFTVICRWHPPGDACEPSQLFAVAIARCIDAHDAANNACLHLIRDRQGMAEPCLVVEGQPSLLIPDRGTFDAEEFDEAITFAGKIVSNRKLS